MVVGVCRVFIGFQWVLIGLQFIAQAIVPDVPEEVEIQLARNEFINEKVIEKVEDEDFGQPEEMEVDGDEDEGGEKKKTCCGLLPSTQKKTKMKQLDHEYPVNPYPLDHDPVAWPKPLQTDPNASTLSRQASSKVAGHGHDPTFHNYAGAAAVPESPNKDDGMVRNPTAAYY